MQPKTQFGKLLILTFLATVIAEVLSGSTTLSRIQTLPAQFLIYGSAAILVRDITRRIHGGWFTILMLGWAFGILLEGVSLQSVFNANFLNLDISLGRNVGVNWVWAFYMPAYHGVWSIAAPILVTELIFPKEKDQPWAGPVVIWVFGVILLIMGIFLHFIFVKLFTYEAGPVLATCAVPVLVLVFLAIKGKRFGTVAKPVGHNSSWLLLAVITFIAGTLWYAGFASIFIAQKPAPWVPLVAAPLIASVYFLLIAKWSMIGVTSDMHRLGLVAGLLFSGWIFGYSATLSNTMDHWAQIGLVVPIALLLYWLYRRLDKTPASA